MKKAPVAILIALLAAGAGAVSLGLVELGDEPATNTGLPAPAAPVMTPAEAMRQRPAAEQLALAQQAAFGTSGVATVPGTEGGEMRYAPGEIVWLGQTAVLLSPGTNSEDCHACSGGIAITYLRPAGDRFAVAGKWMDAVPGNGFGQPPSEIRVRTDLAPTPVLVAEAGFVNQGYSCGTTTLAALTPTGPVVSDPLPTSYSNEGAVDPDTGQTMGGEPARSLEGEIADVRPGEGFTVRAGAVADRYVWRDGKPVREGDESRLACD